MTKQDILDLAYAEEEYAEKAKTYLDRFGVSVLYDKTNFSGHDNLTKYAYELHAAGLGHPNGFAWCQTWVNWTFWTCYGTELADELLCGMLRSASTMDVKDAFLAKGRQVPLNMAKPGDLVFRSRKGGGHVEIVAGRTPDGQIISIGGNTSPTDKNSWNGGQVARHVGATWEWCVRPDYSILPKEPEKWHWVHSGGKWYHQDSKGRNSYGWKNIKETAGEKVHCYWFDSKGAAASGARKIDDTWYFFMPEGDLECALCVTDAKAGLKVWSE